MAGGRAIRAGRAFVELFADDRRLVRGLRRAQRRLRSAGQSIAGVGARLGGFAAVAGAGLGAMVRQFIQVGDQLDKMSIRTGISAEALSELGFAAEQNGSSLETLGKAILRMNRRLGRITAGQAEGSQVEALKALGLTAEELERLSPEERLLAIADAMSRMADPAEAAGLAQRAFGTQVDEILPLLLQGRAGIEAYREEARRLGLTLSQDTAASAAALLDALNRLFRVVKRVGVAIGASLAPMLTDIADKAALAARWVLDFSQQNRGLVVGFAKIVAIAAVVAAVLLTVGAVVLGASAALGILASAIGVITGIIGALLSPIGIAIAAVVALGVAILRWTGAGSRAMEFLRERVAALGQFFRRVLGGIRDALAAGDIEAAAEVLWAGLQVLWLKGTLRLRKLWVDLRTGLVSGFVTARAQLEQIWNDLTSFLATRWINMIAGLRSLWVRFSAFFRSNAVSLAATVAKALTEVLSLIPGFDGSGIRQGIDAVLGPLKAQIKAEKEAALNEIEAQRTGRNAIIENERQRASREVAKAALEVQKAMQRAAEQGRDAADKRLEEAQTRLDEAIARAAEAKRQAEAQQNDSPTGFDPDLPDELADGLASSGAIDPVGGFSGRLVARLVGDVDSARIADATERTARHTEEIARDARKGKAFA